MKHILVVINMVELTFVLKMDLSVELNVMLMGLVAAVTLDVNKQPPENKDHLQGLLGHL